MRSYLDEILEATRARIARSKREISQVDLEGMAQQHSRRDFRGAISAMEMSLIAEFKRRSPSAGEIRPGAEPGAIAAAYAGGGASALSILTEPDFFGGSLQDLRLAREASGLPVLRKDFVLDPYQVAEAGAIGADAVLMIVAALPDGGLLRDLASAAADESLAALFEVHDEWELERAMELDPKIVGINQRDLRTLEIDAGLAVRLRKRVPAGVVVVAESGISGRPEVETLQSEGIDAVLVGESLMRSEDPRAAVAELLGG